MRRIILSALFAAVAAMGAHAADSDNAGPLPVENKGASSGAPSYFEGVWVGAWPSFQLGSASQDVTVTIERGKKDGVFRVEYAWGAVSWRKGTIMPGSVRVKGREEDDRFVFKWTNKQGNDVEVTLRKHEDNAVKARLEKSGPLATNDRPFNETILKRK